MPINTPEDADAVLKYCLRKLWILVKVLIYITLIVWLIHNVGEFFLIKEVM